MSSEAQRGRAGSVTSSTPGPSAAAQEMSADRSRSSFPPTNKAKNSSPQQNTTVSMRASQSQLMTASNSQQSESAAEKASDKPSTSTSTPAPYGTRSRNRTGASRPNYAEDHSEMDFEMAAPVKTTTSNATSTKKSTASPRESLDAAGPADSERASGVSTRRAGATTNGTSTSNGVTSNAAAKETIPGMSSFSSNPNGSSTQATRKRKHATTNGTNTPTAASGGASKKALGFNDIVYRTQGDMMSFDKCKARLKDGVLKADDGTTLRVNDHVYLVCEPPGEPYYLARIMAFIPNHEKPGSPIDSVKVNWYYRPRDIQRNTTDTRIVYASMHSDTCPLTSLRGTCQILHQAEIADLDEFRRQRDSYWFSQLFDRYMRRYYEVLPTKQVINVPPNVKKVLDDHWKFVIVEAPKAKEYTAQPKTCSKCGGYCASDLSVDCAVCHNTYHMHCVRPVLTKKPARGFAWACGPCGRIQERKIQARNTPRVGEAAVVDEEMVEEEEEDPSSQAAKTTAPSPAAEDVDMVDADTAEQMDQIAQWPYRYLGMHCKPEDALDFHDRIYPRASSRLGPRHQANVISWPGRPIEYVKPAESKRKYKTAGGRGNYKTTTTTTHDSEKSKKIARPPWVLDQPPGYIARGEDNSSTVVWRMPDLSKFSERGGSDDPESTRISEEDREKAIDDFMKRSMDLRATVGVEEGCTNFLTKCLTILSEKNYDVNSALAKIKKFRRREDLDEPELSPEEVKKFEQGVAKYGSELWNITKHVGSVPHRRIVRFYYIWKKTPKGRQIWGNYENRQAKKEAKKADPSSAKLLDDVADDHDDSAFDDRKASDKKRGFKCKFCSTKQSPRWRRAPGTQPGAMYPAEGTTKKDKGQQVMVALCQRCAYLWRHYGIQWENQDEIIKKASQGGNRAWKKRFDQVILDELEARLENPQAVNPPPAPLPPPTSTSTPVPQSAQEPPKKKAKTDKDVITNGTTDTGTKKKPVQPVEPPQPPRPLTPDIPKTRTLPCAICSQMEPMGDEHITCRDCRLTVHRSCYGVQDLPNAAKWICEMCANDRSPLTSTSYSCVLCPVRHTEIELMEMPKKSHRKKSELEKEKERREREIIDESLKTYRQRQASSGRPIAPREPLKRTNGNNWAHVMCSVWVPEVKFSSPRDLELAEGFGSIPLERFQTPCKLCKSTEGAVVMCHNSQCNVQFHVGCAFQAGYRFGIDVVPVKSSRRDHVSTIKLGEENGTATAAIWCPNHTIPTIVHEMNEVSEEDGQTALQLYVQTFKQADLTFTGTARKAAYVQQNSDRVPATNRRASLIHAGNVSPIDTSVKLEGASEVQEKKCSTCERKFSPKWYTVKTRRPNGVNGVAPAGQPVAMEEMTELQCHRCYIKPPPVAREPQLEPRPDPTRGPPLAPATNNVPAMPPQPPVPMEYARGPPPQLAAHPGSRVHPPQLSSAPPPPPSQQWAPAMQGPPPHEMVHPQHGPPPPPIAPSPHGYRGPPPPPPPQNPQGMNGHRAHMPNMDGPAPPMSPYHGHGHPQYSNRQSPYSMPVQPPMHPMAHAGPPPPPPPAQRPDPRGPPGPPSAPHSGLQGHSYQSPPPPMMHSPASVSSGPHRPPHAHQHHHTPHRHPSQSPSLQPAPGLASGQPPRSYHMERVRAIEASLANINSGPVIPSVSPSANHASLRPVNGPVAQSAPTTPILDSGRGRAPSLSLINNGMPGPPPPPTQQQGNDGPQLPPPPPYGSRPSAASASPSLKNLLS